MVRGRGFRTNAPSMHAHATRIGQRADNVSQVGSSATGAALPGNALGNVGASSTAGHQRFVNLAGGTLGRIGSRLRGQASLLHRTATNVTDTDTEHATRIRGIDPSARTAAVHSTGATRGSSGASRTPPPVPPKPPRLHASPPVNRPSWMQIDQHGWPVQPANNRYPKVFNPQNAQGEQFESKTDANGNQWVTVYRYADGGDPEKWQSNHRNSHGGNFNEVAPAQMNDHAMKQSRFGNQSDNATGIPYVSVTTNPAALRTHGEPWVQNIINSAPNLGKFEVPASSLYRPSIPSASTKAEQEWLYYDGAGPLTDFGHIGPNNRP